MTDAANYINVSKHVIYYAVRNNKPCKNYIWKEKQINARG